MEPSNGDVYKMFLGSLDPKWDRRANAANSMVPSTPIKSPQLSPCCEFSSRSDTPRSDRFSTSRLLSASTDDPWTTGSEGQARTSTSSYSRAGPEEISPQRAERYEEQASGSSTIPRTGRMTYHEGGNLGRSSSTRSSATAGSRSPSLAHYQQSQYRSPSDASESSHQGHHSSHWRH